MSQVSPRTLGELTLDPGEQRLLLRGEPVSLTPRAFAVLCRLADPPGRLVTKEDLLAAVWEDAFVSDAVLKVAVREIRRALGDDARSPRFIETVHRRGYRLLLPGGEPAARLRASGSLVGRDRARQRLLGLAEAARGGRLSIGFVTGELGIGKSALVASFLAEVAERGGAWTARGQCLEQFGEGEAYLPLLDALGRLGRGPGRAELVDVLCRYAPSWLAQLPSLAADAQQPGPAPGVPAASRERMLREVSEALESLSEDRLVVLLLEDLQWSDRSTVELISYLARRGQPCRLLLIGTHRVEGGAAGGHPVSADFDELLAHGKCDEVRLRRLTVDDVARYLSERFSGVEPVAELASRMHARSGGNPLFLVNLSDALVERGVLSPDGEGAGRWRLASDLDAVDLSAPRGLRRLVRQQLRRLDPEDHRLLEAASVLAAGCSAVAVAAAAGIEPAVAEKALDRLACDGHLLRPDGLAALPAGISSPSFRFDHSLYQSVLYEGMTASRRLRLHRRVGEAAERLFGADAAAFAHELAVHFELAGNAQRSIHYLELAAERSAGRGAASEAAAYLERARALAAQGGG